MAIDAVSDGCISEWGHDFRPEYRELKRLRQLFPATPVGAFTATATRRVQADIKAQLGLQRAASFRGSFNRPNLFYEVRPKRAAYAELFGYLRGRGRDSGIIYCHTRAATEQLAAKLRADGLAAYVRQSGAQPIAGAMPWRASELSDTIRLSVDLFKAGRDVAGIAAARGLARSMIEGHLAEAIAAGEPLELERLVGVEKRQAIEAAMAALGRAQLKPVLEYLGDGYSYAELRFVRAALEATS